MKLNALHDFYSLDQDKQKIHLFPTFNRKFL